jgi:hypothetical protein
VSRSGALYTSNANGNIGHDPATDTTFVNWTPQLPSSAVTASGTDAFGRTQVMGSSTITAPALREIVSVAQAPWNAKGDAKVVADGAITSGTNTVSSATAGWTTAANAGQYVMVVGAGTAGGMLYGYISTVAGNVASLVTTQGGGTPANASTTVASGATVKFGTDDTAAWQAAEDAVSAHGGGTIIGVIGAQYIVGGLVPKSNVAWDLRGVTVHMKFKAGYGGVWGGQVPQAGVSNWGLRGGTFPGTQLETGTQQHAVIWCSSANQNSDIFVAEVQVSNWTAAVLELENCTRAHALYCRFTGVICTVAENNAIAFGARATVGLHMQHCYAIGNYIENCATECITFVTTGSVSTTEVRGEIIGNNCSVTGTGGSAAIQFELSTTAATEYSQFIVANNICVNNCVGIGSYAMFIGGFAGATQLDPWFGRKIIIQGNILDSTTSNGRGLGLAASEVEVIGNVITAQQLAFVITSGTVTVTGTTTNGSPTITSITGTQSVNMTYAQLIGTGIAQGSYLVSGATTATWTMSLNATASGTVTITLGLPWRHVDASHNTIHCTSTAPGNYSLYLSQVIHSTFAHNRVYQDGGATNTQSLVLIQYCGWLDIHHLVSEWSGGHGIWIQGNNDITLAHCRVYNCADDGVTGYYGYYWVAMSGVTNKMESCVAVDDRAVHTMQCGVRTDVTSNSTVAMVNCEFHGYTASASQGTFRFARGNVDDTHAGGDVFLLTASNGSWPLPAGATLVRVTAIGGGGQGAGGGVSGGTATQVGGSGGCSGTFVSQIVPVGSATTANVTIGAGGTGAGAGGGTGGGASGSAGSPGNGGSATTVAIGATTVRAYGGGPGAGGGANSSGLVNSRLWGAQGGGTGAASSQPSAGQGGYASSTIGDGSGDPFGQTGSGGGGGGPTSATLGGLGGGAGSLSAAVGSVGAGGSGTAAGGNGASASANTGGGGGGGGGGAWNGGAPGAGGNGGNGGSGYVIIEVLS